ncbi:hypothetical protein B0H10DRAFT_2218549 [Mycena sp. CBHHK59/15]|nr:hypothetical protein B0H10DRAFT_2218549 [Mycena sp. CBHHK59/15]
MPSSAARHPLRRPVLHATFPDRGQPTTPFDRTGNPPPLSRFIDIPPAHEVRGKHGGGNSGSGGILYRWARRLECCRVAPFHNNRVVIVDAPISHTRHRRRTLLRQHHLHSATLQRDFLLTRARFPVVSWPTTSRVIAPIRRFGTCLPAEQAHTSRATAHSLRPDADMSSPPSRLSRARQHRLVSAAFPLSEHAATGLESVHSSLPA